MKWLPDVNLLVALLSEEHVHHEQAQSWFKAASGQGWCTTPLTELGLLRILCLPGVMEDPLNPADAMQILDSLKGHPNWKFAAADFPAGEALDSMQLQGHNQINDGYLLGLAARKQLTLATFDKGFASLLKRGDKRRAHLHVLPVGSTH